MTYKEVIVPEAFENFGDCDWHKYGGQFVKKNDGNIYFVIMFKDMNEIVEHSERWLEVEYGYVDITDFNHTEELEKHDIENVNEVSASMLATIIFDNYGYLEFGDKQEFNNEKDAYEFLSNLFNKC